MLIVSARSGFGRRTNLFVICYKEKYLKKINHFPRPPIIMGPRPLDNAGFIQAG